MKSSKLDSLCFALLFAVALFPSPAFAWKDTVINLTVAKHAQLQERGWKRHHIFLRDLFRWAAPVTIAASAIGGVGAWEAARVASHIAPITREVSENQLARAILVYPDATFEAEVSLDVSGTELTRVQRNREFLITPEFLTEMGRQYTNGARFYGWVKRLEAAGIGQFRDERFEMDPRIGAYGVFANDKLVIRSFAWAQDQLVN